ncbi:VanZ family protein [Protaetiibacter larvae]|nr:VanZ family protein [Protaetiibacter larvae]
MDRVLPGLVALAIGAVAAVVLLIPFVAVSYRRRGGLTPGRTLAWLALLLWILGVQAYTLLPIPSGDIVCAGIELDPLQAVRDVFDPVNRGGGPLRNTALQQLVLNVLLFVPWGVLVRALWRRGFVVATASGLGISLLIETTQLTGVWGAFPCAYRLFDTADLATNTLGALLGSLVALPFLRRRAAAVPRLSGEVTLGRRLIGMLCDVLAVLLTTVAIAIVGNAVQLYLVQVRPGELDGALSSEAGAVAALVLSWLVVLFSGSTLGEAAVWVQGVDGRRPHVLWRTVRFAFGIGGFQALLLVPAWGALLALGFALVTVLVAWRSRGHRGLALLVAGMRLRILTARDEP